MNSKIKSLWKSLAIFVFTFFFALAVTNIWKLVASYSKAEKSLENYQIQNNFPVKSEKNNLIHKEKGRGSAACGGKYDSGNKNLFTNRDENTKDKKIFITNKPQPRYTEAAKANNIQGTVRLRVTFLSNGKIGSVSEVAGLPFGLTESAIEAAKKIKFKPQTQNGEPVAVTRVVAYTFSIY